MKWILITIIIIISACINLSINGKPWNHELGFLTGLIVALILNKFE